jgi:uncharacterized protein YndB with AHSA1/START domain
MSLTSTKVTTDRIEKKTLLRAPRSRVWRALTDAAEFSEWFGAKLEGRFVVGKTIQGKMGDGCAKSKEVETTMKLTVERMDPETRFSYRWHPYAIDPVVDYSKEPTTLVEFRLDEVKEGTMLTVVESGFDEVPAGRRAEAFRMHTDGWVAQLENIKGHVSG